MSSLRRGDVTLALPKEVKDALGLKLGSKQDLVRMPKQSMKQSACVFFFGKPAAEYFQSIQRGTKKGWGGAASDVRYFLLDKPVMSSLQLLAPDGTLKSISDEDLQDLFDKMRAPSAAFPLGSANISVYCLLDSSVLASEDDFTAWFNFVKEIKEVSGDIVMSKMLLLLLREGTRYQAFAKKIRRKLWELDRATHAARNYQIYDSVFVLSTLAHGRNDQSGTKPLPTRDDGRFFLDYPLFADLLLLSNTQGNTWRLLYPSGEHTQERIAFFSAAYRYDKKPTEQIVLLALYETIECIQKEKEWQEKSIVLSDRLHVLISRWIDHIISQLSEAGIPDMDFLALLPGKPEEDESFERRTQSSAQCLTAFFESEFQAKLEALIAHQSANLQESYECDLRRELSFLAFTSMSDVNDCPRIFEKAVGKMDYLHLPVGEGVAQLLRWRVLQQIQPHALKAFQEVFVQAQSCERAYNGLRSDILSDYSAQNPELREKIEAHYSTAIRDYLKQSILLPAQFVQVFRITPIVQDLLSVMQTFVDKMFSEKQIFQIDYANELQDSDDGTKAQKVVEKLKLHIDSDVHFSSRHQTPLPVLHAYFLDTMDEQSRLYALLSTPSPGDPPITIFDSANSNMAEALWVYAYPQGHLKEEG